MNGLGKLTSASPAMCEALQQVGHAGPYGGGVLLRGEYGSGRETIVRELHRLSRPNRPFVVVDVAAIPHELLEASLFGYHRSTFTGGSEVRRGVFETAEAGTVLIREIGALHLELQPKLMRLIKRREFRRIGDNVNQRFNGRVFCTTHCAIEELVSIGWCRPDLLPIIGGDADVVIPPLRERIADLPALLAHHGVTLETALLERLSRLAWRGNVRELEAFVRRLETLAPADAVTERELLQAIEDNPDDDGPRLVYGDFLSSRGDSRGELIQVQCRITGGHGTPTIHAAERKSLGAHLATWAAPVVEAASTTSVPAHATLKRGFVDHLLLDTPVLRRFDAILRAAPLLTHVVARDFHSSDCWVSPQLRRLRGVEVVFATLGGVAFAEFLRGPYLSSIETLVLSSGGSDEDETVDPNEPALCQAGIEALSTSSTFAGVTALTLGGFPLDATNLATLLAETARWRLDELALWDAGLGVTELAALVAAPRAGALQSLDLRGNVLDAATARVLAAAGSLANLTGLLVDELDAPVREILHASPTLAKVRIFEGAEP